MPTQLEVTEALGLWPINARKKKKSKSVSSNVECCTHLAINWGCLVEINQEELLPRGRTSAKLSKSIEGIDLD
jgi:hypothetical protein